MTVIVWDGYTLAADRMASDNWTNCNATTKISRVRGHLVGRAGPTAATKEMEAWFADGALPERFPSHLRSADNIDMLVVAPDGVISIYQNGPFPVVFTNNQIAIGSGKEAAQAVMMMGGDSRKAVQIASKISNGCGGGIDELRFIKDGRSTRYRQESEEEIGHVDLLPFHHPQDVSGGSSLSYEQALIALGESLIWTTSGPKIIKYTPATRRSSADPFGGLGHFEVKEG